MKHKYGWRVWLPLFALFLAVADMSGRAYGYDDGAEISLAASCTVGVMILAPWLASAIRDIEAEEKEATVKYLRERIKELEERLGVHL